MFCPHCSSTLANGATLCLTCRKKLYAYEPPIHASQASPSTSLEEKSQCKAKQHFRISTAFICILLLLTLGGWAGLFYKMIITRSELGTDDIAVLATTLTMLGTFYLAYDLLGRQQGPLFWVSLVVTSGWIGGMTLGPLILVFVLAASIGSAVRFLLICALQGAFAGLVFALNRNTYQDQVFSLRKALLGIMLSITFWIAFFFLFFTKPFNNMLVYMVIFLLICGVPIGLLIGGFHRFFQDKIVSGNQRPEVFSWAHFFKASLIFIPMWVLIASVANLAGGTMTPLWIIGYSLLISLAGLVPGGFAEHIWWWLNQRPPRILGVIGLALGLIGALVSAMPPINHILSILHK